MKTLNHPIAAFLVMLALMFSSAQATAVETFNSGGVILEIGATSFKLESGEYRIGPGAKLQSFDDSRKRFSDFRVGDLIVIEGKILSGIHYVDLIIYHPPFDS